MADDEFLSKNVIVVKRSRCVYCPRDEGARDKRRLADGSQEPFDFINCATRLCHLIELGRRKREIVQVERTRTDVGHVRTW